MKIKFSFIENEPIGIGVYRILYETQLRPEEYPSFSALKDKIEEEVLLNLGTTLEEARKDEAYTMGLIVKRTHLMGKYVPGDYYTLVITMSNAIKRIERQFTIEEKI